MTINIIYIFLHKNTLQNQYMLHDLDRMLMICQYEKTSNWQIEDTSVIIQQIVRSADLCFHSDVSCCVQMYGEELRYVTL